MNQPRIAVFAYSEVGHACLKFLLERGENVRRVYTHEETPGENVWFPSVANLARNHGVPVDTRPAEAASLSADLIFSFYYRNLIPMSLLRTARLGAFNMHGSLLPRYRGRAPVNWAVLNGEKYSGATLHVMVEKADAGDIVDQEAVIIGPDDTAAMVQKEVTAAAVKVLARQIDLLKAGKAPRRAQNQELASYFGRRRPEDGKIDWHWPAERIHNLVRAVTHPYPGAFGELGGQNLSIWKTRLNPIDSNGFIVTCGDGKKIEILEFGRSKE